MARPPRCRRVEFLPQVTYFKPAEVPLTGLEEVQLTVEELEALRLKDLEGLEQEECAARMDVSRPTFQRILAAARAKVAEALVTGKAIRVEGGNFCAPGLRLLCVNCGHEWESTAGAGEGEVACPACGSARVGPVRCRRGRGQCRRWRGGF